MDRINTVIPDFLSLTEGQQRSKVQAIRQDRKVPKGLPKLRKQEKRQAIKRVEKFLTKFNDLDDEQQTKFRSLLDEHLRSK